jgi:hypothetical protein
MRMDEHDPPSQSSPTHRSNSRGAFLGAARADAASYLGSPDTSAPPDAFACADCPQGTSIGLKQFALRGAPTEAPEDGVLVSASVYAKRIAGGEQPRIAVLVRPRAAAWASWWSIRRPCP